MVGSNYRVMGNVYPSVAKAHGGYCAECVTLLRLGVGLENAVPPVPLRLVQRGISSLDE